MLGWILTGAAFALFFGLMFYLAYIQVYKED